MRRPAALKLACSIKDRIGLLDWDVTMSDEEPEDGALADVTVLYGTRIARMSLATKALKLSHAGLVYVITHELLHVHLWQLGEHYRRAIQHMPPASQEFADQTYLEADEMVVDKLASVLAPLLADKRNKGVRPHIPHDTVF